MTLERSLIEHCAPTLAGLKTGSMFGAWYPSARDLREDLRGWNRRLAGKGVCFLPLRYENCRYRTGEDYVEYQCGFIFLTRNRVMRRAVLYVTVVRSPFSLLFRTRTLVVRSMGGSMVIPFLPIQDAEALLKDITPRCPAVGPRLFSEKGAGHE